jgi:hypothetical protein
MSATLQRLYAEGSHTENAGRDSARDIVLDSVAQTGRGRSFAFGGFCLKAAALLGLWLGATACQGVGVGDPCIPEDEYRTDFGGYSKDEVNIESRSFQCETRVCLVNKFQGRVSCPYGTKNGGACETPDLTDTITVPVQPQLLERRPEQAVYCSCRCDGEKSNAPYCECPEGFSCENLIDDIGLGNAQLAGSYCVRTGTNKGADEIGSAECTGNACD